MASSETHIAKKMRKTDSKVAMRKGVAPACLLQILDADDMHTQATGRRAMSTQAAQSAQKSSFGALLAAVGAFATLALLRRGLGRGGVGV